MAATQDSGCCCGAGLWRALRRQPDEAEAISPQLSCLRHVAGPGAPEVGRAEQRLRPKRLKSKVFRRADEAAQADGQQSPTRLRIIDKEMLEDRYVIQEVVGEGANGVVRVVADKRSSQRRVLKSLSLGKAVSKVHFEELMNEMEVYLKVDHPNICKLLEVYVEEDSCHLIMELCTGRELFERWDGKGLYSEQDTRLAVSQMLDAIQYLHSMQICHRDLKLENWVYADKSEKSRLKLIDFGFANIVTPDKPMTAILGTAFYMAPEVLNGCYDAKCDIWSTGVITHMLLTGLPPFGDYEDSDNRVMKKIASGVPMREDAELWKSISSEANTFVNELLVRDPAKRPTASAAAQHSWLRRAGRGASAEAPEDNRQVLENMRSFASTNVIKRAACCLIAYSMSVDEADHLEAQFKRLDKDGNGTITMHAMVDALKEHCGMNTEQARQLFSKLDLTGDHKINYSEFLAAACQRRFLSQESHIQEAFRRFDVDRTGYISLENLRAVLGDTYNGTRVEDILDQVDAKRNGVIEYDEFVRALMDIGTHRQGTRAPAQVPENVDVMRQVSKAVESFGQSSASKGTASKKKK